MILDMNRMGSCCSYHQFNPAISDRKVYEIESALDDMYSVHSDELPPLIPTRIPHDIRLCMCIHTECNCIINYDRLVYHILRTIQYRTYSIKGSSGYKYSSQRLTYLLHIAQQQ